MEREVGRKKRHWNKFTIYVPDNKVEVVLKAQEMFRREGTSLSKFAIEKIEEHHRLHEAGNPQQLLPVILKLGKMYHAPNPVCRMKDCFRKVDVVLNWKKSPTETEQVGFCEKHGEFCLRSFPLVYNRLKVT